MTWLRKAEQHEPVVVTLYSRQGCCLCDEARERILSLEARVPLRLNEVLIDEDPILMRKYGNYVPVVTVGDRLTVVSRLSLEALIWALRSAQDAI